MDHWQLEIVLHRLQEYKKSFLEKATYLLVFKGVKLSNNSGRVH